MRSPSDIASDRRAPIDGHALSEFGGLGHSGLQVWMATSVRQSSSTAESAVRGDLGTLQMCFETETPAKKCTQSTIMRTEGGREINAMSCGLARCGITLH